MFSQMRALKQRALSLLAALLLLLPLAAIAFDDKSDELLMISSEFCPACMAAKRFFEEHNISYSEYGLEESKRVRQTFERLGGRGTPLLYKNGDTMNGFHPQRFRRFWANATGKEIPR